MQGPQGRPGGPLTLITCFSLLYLNLPKRHLAQIQDLFYQTFRYFVKQKKFSSFLSVNQNVEKSNSMQITERALFVRLLLVFPITCIVTCTSLLISLCALASVRVLKLASLNSLWCFLMFLVALKTQAQAQSVVNSQEVRLGVIAPNDTTGNEHTLQQVLPPVRLAIKAVSDPLTGILPGWKFQLEYRNSNCSSTTGALAAVELHKNVGKSHIFQFLLIQVKLSIILFTA